MLPQTIPLTNIELTLPGQWADGETGLVQNWHRDYDPSLGRYIQADPLGIAAGQSIYGYVSQDPLNKIDPEGLQVCAACGRLGAEHGAAIVRDPGGYARGVGQGALSTGLDSMHAGVGLGNFLFDGDAKFPISYDPPAIDDPSEMLGRDAGMAAMLLAELGIPAGLLKTGTSKVCRLAPKIGVPENRVPHIFRDADGHLPDTIGNRNLLTDVANDPAAALGADKWGNQWAARNLGDGSQAWTQSRNGDIINGGINSIPRSYNPETGLSNLSKKGK